MKSLSYGAGMQSTTLALMSCENAYASGLLPYPKVPMYDAVIYCDPGLKPPWVYRQLEFTQKACENTGIFFKVLDTPLYQDFLENFGEQRTISIPWWTLSDKGKKSKMPRNCTIDYKVEEITKFVHWELLGYKRVSSSTRRISRPMRCTWVLALRKSGAATKIHTNYL